MLYLDMFPYTDVISESVDMSFFLFGNTDVHCDIYRISSRDVETVVLLSREKVDGYEIGKASCRERV